MCINVPCYTVALIWEVFCQCRIAPDALAEWCPCKSATRALVGDRPTLWKVRRYYSSVGEVSPPTIGTMKQLGVCYSNITNFCTHLVSNGCSVVTHVRRSIFSEPTTRANCFLFVNASSICIHNSQPYTVAVLSTNRPALPAAVSIPVYSMTLMGKDLAHSYRQPYRVVLCGKMHRCTAPVVSHPIVCNMFVMQL